MHKTREIGHARRAIIQERKRQRQYEKWRKPVGSPNDPDNFLPGEPCEHKQLDRITDEDYGCHYCGAPFVVEIDVE